MPHPGQYMVGRFLCAFCCVSQTGVRDETETQIVFLFHTGRRPNPNPCLACPCCCCQRALQLPVKRIPPYGANGNLFSKKKNFSPVMMSTDVIMTCFCQCSVQAADKLGTEVVLKGDAQYITLGR
jgi:hypothetical protein